MSALFTDQSQIPVTLLTGFLGAGKTTILNHLVRDPALARTLVIDQRIRCGRDRP